jgi:peroxiredoxin
MRRNPMVWPGIEVVWNLKNLKKPLALAGLVLMFHLSALASDRTPPAYLAGGAANKVGNFLLQDHTGKGRELYDLATARAVVLMFTMTGCPIVQKSIPKIKALRDQFEPKGVVFWLVNSNPADDLASIGEEARDFRVDLPVLLDHAQNVARALGATRTAEVICIQPKSWTVFYRGAIDDQLGYGTEKRQASHAFLENALDGFLTGKAIEPAHTEVKGCLFQFEPSSRAEKK